MAFRRGSKVRILKGAVLSVWNSRESRDVLFCPLIDFAEVRRVQCTSYGRNHIKLWGRSFVFYGYQLQGAK